MMDLSEAGPLEMAQIAVLAAASGVFLFSAIKRSNAGAPALALFALILGIAALREYDTEVLSGWQAYVASHSARWHLALALSLPLILIAIRDRRISVITHARAVLRLLPVFILGIGLVWLAAAIEEWGGTLETTSEQKIYLLLVEELLELAAYAITLAAAVRYHLRAKSRRPALHSPLITYLPTRPRKPWHRFGSA